MWNLYLSFEAGALAYLVKFWPFAFRQVRLFGIRHAILALEEMLRAPKGSFITEFIDDRKLVEERLVMLRAARTEILATPVTW